MKLNIYLTQNHASDMLSSIEVHKRVATRRLFLFPQRVLQPAAPKQLTNWTGKRPTSWQTVTRSIADILKCNQPEAFDILAAFCRHDGKRWTRKVIQMNQRQSEPVDGRLAKAL